ncbi:cyclin-dependent kinase 2-associated protein 1 isoform X2 [Pyrgilauda ruficollis]|uniref:cyclin-dependent kinase 2-associated protein 1 isoform X2 n=1 Tax=Pyrgilauda ruficollis TaxID=221976 RepID=UPI001B881EC3|nr:cyclin-dependent kinase 2-associated protein 1 isoform X2 [Pyrgilauda ruficollis]
MAAHPRAPPCAGRRAAAAGGCRLSPKVFGSASPHDVWMIYCIVGVNITDGHICRCCYCCKQPKVSGRHGDASLNFRTLLLLPLAMSLGMSYKPNLNAHIPGTPLNPGISRRVFAGAAVLLYIGSPCVNRCSLNKAAAAIASLWDIWRGSR